jgi:hypothetical protein
MADVSGTGLTDDREPRSESDSPGVTYAGAYEAVAELSEDEHHADHEHTCGACHQAAAIAMRRTAESDTPSFAVLRRLPLCVACEDLADSGHVAELAARIGDLESEAARVLARALAGGVTERARPPW